ncbi:MAG: hypothetical protein KAV97_05690 [Actinomycetia bacterium]|nr:hypothetical protein [Actinomycetes bacterium]
MDDDKIDYRKLRIVFEIMKKLDAYNKKWLRNFFISNITFLDFEHKIRKGLELTEGYREDIKWSLRRH